jgi:hypothetical protein
MTSPVQTPKASQVNSALYAPRRSGVIPSLFHSRYLVPYPTSYIPILHPNPTSQSYILTLRSNPAQATSELPRPKTTTMPSPRCMMCRPHRAQSQWRTAERRCPTALGRRPFCNQARDWPKLPRLCGSTSLGCYIAALFSTAVQQLRKVNFFVGI